MAKETTNAGNLGDLAKLAAALEANAADLGHIEGARLKLAKVVADAQEVTQQQAALRAGKQEASKRLRTLLVEGQRLANGLRVLLREHYGIRSEKLAEFGLLPFRGRPRTVKPKTKKPETPPPPAAEPAVPPES